MRDSLIQELQAFYAETGVSTVLIPVNFESAHWCGIVIRIPEKRILFYDPLNQTDYKRALEDLAQDAAAKVFDNFALVALNSPIQRDMFSCGVFVVWMFYRQVNKHAIRNMLQLERRRFELFYYVLFGRQPPQDPTVPDVSMHSDDDEEKAQVPTQPTTVSTPKSTV
jgi:hypothetical protein